jgi:hypothetical protein
MAKPEQDWNPVTKANFLATHKATGVAPSRVSRRIFHTIKGPHRMTSVRAGATAPVHAAILEKNYKQMVVPVDGQADVLLLGVPYLGPYNVNSIMNPSSSTICSSATSSICTGESPWCAREASS